MLRAPGLALACLLAACAPDPPDELGHGTQAITGGTSDTADPGVVLLYAEDGSTAYICTASVIAPRVLLTAAHCVSSTLHSAATKYYGFFGPDLNAAKPGDLHAVSEVHAHPDWDIDDLAAGHDVGIAILQDATTIAPLPLRRTALAQADDGKTLRLVGYGATDGTSGAGTGVKRQTQTALDAFDDVTITYNDTMHLTCNGDSGGPAFLTRNGTEEIIGLTSFGDKACTQFGVDTRVDAELAFIDPLVTQAAAAPAAARYQLQPAAFQYVGGDVKTDEPATGDDLKVGGCSLAPRGSADARALVALVAIGLLLFVRRRARAAA